MQDFVNNNGGNSSIINPSIDRVDWDKVQQVLNGNQPISELGCN